MWILHPRLAMGRNTEGGGLFTISKEYWSGPVGKVKGPFDLCRMTWGPSVLGGADELSLWLKEEGVRLTDESPTPGPGALRRPDPCSAGAAGAWVSQRGGLTWGGAMSASTRQPASKEGFAASLNTCFAHKELLSLRPPFQGQLFYLEPLTLVLPPESSDL